MGSSHLHEVSCCSALPVPLGAPQPSMDPQLRALLWGLSQMGQPGSALTRAGKRGSARVHGWAREVDTEQCRPREDGLRWLNGPLVPELWTRSTVAGLPAEFLGPLQQVGHLPRIPRAAGKCT